MVQHKILFVTHEYSAGGIERFISSFSKYLSKKSFKCLLHSWQNIGKPEKHLTSYQIKYSYNLPFFVRWPVAFLIQHYSLVSLYLIHKPKIIIFNSTKSTVFSLFFVIFIKIFSHSTSIFQFHGSRKFEQQSFYAHKNIKTTIKIFLYKKADLLVYSLFEHIIVFSQYSKQLLHFRFGISPQKIKKISPGKTLSISKNKKISKSEIKQELGFANIPFILFASRLEPRKGIEEIHLISSKLKKITKCNIVVCSIFNQISSCTQSFFKYQDQYSTNDSALLIHNPSSPYLQNLYQAADVFVLPSIDYETFGFSSLESLTFGTPVFAYNIGANSEIIKHGHNGWLSPKLNSCHMIKNIKNYLQLSPLKQKAISNNSFSSTSAFSWANYLDFIQNFV